MHYLSWNSKITYLILWQKLIIIHIFLFFYFMYRGFNGQYLIPTFYHWKWTIWNLTLILIILIIEWQKIIKLFWSHVWFTLTNCEKNIAYIFIHLKENSLPNLSLFGNWFIILYKSIKKYTQLSQGSGSWF